MCDLDGYKKLNDTLGHQFGDKILQVTAKIVTWNLRVMDVAARYGGDEFVVLLPHASAELALNVGERIHAQFVAQMKNLVPAELCLTMSMGIASALHNQPANSDQLVALADEALYDAKHRGRIRRLSPAKFACPHPRRADSRPKSLYHVSAPVVSYVP